MLLLLEISCLHLLLFSSTVYIFLTTTYSPLSTSVLELSELFWSGRCIFSDSLFYFVAAVTDSVAVGGATATFGSGTLTGGDTPAVRGIPAGDGNLAGCGTPVGVLVVGRFMATARGGVAVTLVFFSVGVCCFCCCGCSTEVAPVSSAVCRLHRISS